MSKVDGQCPCHVNYGGRQCNQCNPGYYQYPTCFGKHNHECIQNLNDAPLVNFKNVLRTLFKSIRFCATKSFVQRVVYQQLKIVLATGLARLGDRAARVGELSHLNIGIEMMFYLVDKFLSRSAHANLVTRAKNVTSKIKLLKLMTSLHDRNEIDNDQNKHFEL